MVNRNTIKLEKEQEKRMQVLLGKKKFWTGLFLVYMRILDVVPKK